MITIQGIRNNQNKIVVMGNHKDIIQSILDFDYLSGQKEPSVIAIVTGRNGYAKYFFGRREILIPTRTVLEGFEASSPEKQPQKDSPHSNLWFLNLNSGRRTLSSTQQILDSAPSTSDFAGGVFFAENVPELHSLELINRLENWNNDKLRYSTSVPLVVGPASVGLLVPGALKLGPIGGITPDQINNSHLTRSGHLAVLSASGGMTNELINIAISEGHYLSFALSFGGDRFPILSPRDAFLLAEADKETTTVLYYGELGGTDEYELLKLKQEGKFTKHVIAHIAGTVSSLFKEAPQFGHAKAKASNEQESALAKRDALRDAGFQVSDSFSEFISLVAKL